MKQKGRLARLLFHGGGDGVTPAQGFDKIAWNNFGLPKAGPERSEG